MKKTVEEFKEDMLSGLGSYQEAVDIFMRLGLYEFLLERALPIKSPEDSPNHDSLSLIEIGRVRGYNECITDMFEFKETYLSAVKKGAPIRPTFGGISHAISRGDLSPEEAAELLKKKLNGQKSSMSN